MFLIFDEMNFSLIKLFSVCNTTQHHKLRTVQSMLSVGGCVILFEYEGACLMIIEKTLTVSLRE